MKLYSDLQSKDAAHIIDRASECFSIYKISQNTSLNKDKIKRYLNKYKIETRRANLAQPWKECCFTKIE